VSFKYRSDALNTEAKSKSYRPDIDGLRALSVISVVLFHADFDWIPGGFVGVDIFFVISGYLITGIIYHEFRQNDFTLIGFWERRVRRIVPPLALVLLATTIGSYLILFPIELKNFSQSLLAQIFFASNFLFWSEAGYFEAPSKIKPLLHTWSLSIEEQFYVFYPILLAFCLRRSKRLSIVTIVALLLFSLTISIFLVRIDPHTAFFLLPARAWELLLGCLVFFLPVVELHKSIYAFASLVAMAILISCFFLIDSSMPFPGIVAMAPCVSAAVIIYCNQLNKISPTYKFLSTKPLVNIGLLSYSLYLWHWPIFTLAAFHASKPLGVLIHLVLIAISLLLAYISWKFIETPIRKRRILPSRKGIFLSAFMALTIALVAGGTGHVLNGIPQRFSDNVLTAYSGHQYSNPRRRECLFSERRRFAADRICQLGKRTANEAKSQPEFVLVGDSHASSIMPIIDKLAIERKSTGIALAYNGCPPLRGVTRNDTGTIHRCDEFMESSLDIINEEKIPVVILAARWNLYLEEGILSHRLIPDSCAENTQKQAFCNSTATTLTHSLTEFLNKLEQTTKIFLLAQVPQQHALMSPRFLASRILRNQDPNTTATTLESHNQNNAIANSIIDNIKSDSNLSSRHELTVIDVTELLCDENICGIEYQGGSVYRDDDHISTFAGRLVSPAFEVIFEND